VESFGKSNALMARFQHQYSGRAVKLITNTVAESDGFGRVQRRVWMTVSGQAREAMVSKGPLARLQVPVFAEASLHDLHEHLLLAR